MEDLIKQLGTALDMIKVLEAENRLLREKLSPPKNSSNSSVPPSKDENRPPRKSSLRGKSGRGTGGQKGHKGSTLNMSCSPDITKALEPSFCNKCGNDLSDRAASLVSKRQVFDIPPIVPVVTEYRQYSRQCSCGHCQKAAYPAHVRNHVQYGPRVEALIGYCSTYQYLPYKRLSDMLGQVFCLPISQGTVANVLERLAKKAAPVYEGIREQVSKGTVVGADETGAKVNGKKHWAWTWQNSCLTFIVVLATRGKRAVEQFFPQGFPHAVLCSDRWAAHLSTHAKGHQLCLAHLLRDLNYLIEAEGTPWAAQLKALFQKAIRLKREVPEHRPADPKALEIEKEIDHLLGQLPEGQTGAPPQKTLTFHKAMLKHRAYLLTFLYHKEVPPDNNGAERAIRNFKVKMKISGQFKTGQHTFAKLRSIVDTCAKQGIPVFDALTAIAQSEYSAE